MIYPNRSAFIVDKVNFDGEFPIIYLQEMIINGYQSTKEQSDAVRDMQELYFTNDNLQSVPDGNTVGNTVGAIRPQPSTSKRQGDTVRAGGGQGTLLSAEGAKQKNNQVTKETINTEATSQSGAAFFNVESGGAFSLTEPTQKDIARAPDSSDFFNRIISGKQLTNIQRHIVDIANKLDSGIKVEFVDGLSTNGKYIRSQKVLRINAELSTAQMYTQIFKHEFMHYLEAKQLYGKFFKYCFNKSVAFEKYAHASLKLIDNADNRYYSGSVDNMSSKDVINTLTDYYYDRYKSDKSIGGAERDSFTRQNAQEEIVADFFAEVLFQGESYRKRIAQALTTESMLTEGDVQSSEEALLEMKEKEPNLFEKIVEWLRSLTQKLRDIKQAIIVTNDLERTIAFLEKDINKLERKVTRAYNSQDTKKAAESGGVRYSIINLDTGKSYVQASRKIIHGNSVAGWRSQISDFFNKSLKDGPIEITTIEGDTLTISKDTANKARDKHISENGISRELTDNEFLVKLYAEAHIDELAEISVSQTDKNGNKKIVPDKKNHDIAKDGFSYRTVYFQDFDGAYYRIALSIGEDSGVSTVYNVGKIKTDDIPNGNIVSAIGSKADMSSAKYSISNPAENVNENAVGIINISNSNAVDADVVSKVADGGKGNKLVHSKGNANQTADIQASAKHSVSYDTQRASVEGDRKISVAHIKKRDIINIGRSVGAMAKNYDVKLPDGTISKLTEGTSITDIEVFAGKGTDIELRVKYHLVDNYGGTANNWQHTKGRGFVDTADGSKKAMLHWFEEETVGIVEMVVKGWSKK